MKIEDLHLEVLPKNTRRALEYFVTSPLLRSRPWYLAGGTALGLQVGHRQSVDLDFFSPEPQFDTAEWAKELIAASDWQTTLERKGTLYGQLFHAKVSFIAYPFFVPSKNQLHCGAVRMLIPADIAVMKIIALSQRGRKRDFVDVYWYCRNREPLTQIIPRVLQQYPRQKHNMPHILKSLTYFADAEDDPMPNLLFPADWPEVKQYFQHEVPRLAKQLLGLD